MPNASAPNAPCVEVWLSPQTIVIPGCVEPELGARSRARSPRGRCRSRSSGTPNSSQFARERVELRLRERVGDRARRRVGTLWSIVATVRSGRRTRRPASRSPSNACGERHLVHEVQVDVEQRGSPGSLVDDVRVPDLARRACVAISALPSQRSCPKMRTSRVHSRISASAACTVGSSGWPSSTMSKR